MCLVLRRLITAVADRRTSFGWKSYDCPVDDED